VDVDVDHMVRPLFSRNGIIGIRFPYECSIIDGDYLHQASPTPGLRSEVHANTRQAERQDPRGLRVQQADVGLSRS